MSAPTNILLLTTDQHRRDTLGVYGSEVCETPHLDRLAREGVTFQNAFTVTAICTPARTSLFTGLLPFRHGMLANFERNVGYPWEIPEGNQLLPAYLQPRGYACANVGKWHIGIERGPAYYGFEGLHYEGWHPPYEHPDYRRYLQERGLPPFSVSDEVRGRFPNGRPGITQMAVHEAPVEATYPYYLAERTIEQLRIYAHRYRQTGQPFFLACQFWGPHLPYILPREVLERYDAALVRPHPSMAETFARKPTVHENYSRHWGFDTYDWPTWQRIIAAYWGYVSLIDEQIGRILGEVKALGLEKETATCFTSDHGGFVGNHRLADKGPMMYDDIYRIPLLIRWPGVTTEGSTSDALVSLVDLMPTFLDMAAIAQEAYPLDGRTLRPLLADVTAPWPGELFAEFHGHHFPYPQRMVRTHDYKLVVNPPDINELYDLTADPYELHNLYDNPRNAEVQRALMARLYAHLVAAGDNFHHWLPTLYEMDTALSDATADQARVG